MANMFCPNHKSNSRKYRDNFDDIFPKPEIITIWNRYSKKESRYKFNHFTVGYDPDQVKPTPYNETQRKSWGSAVWEKQKGKYIDGKVEIDE